jgi:predicted dehydrogenase
MDTLKVVLAGCGGMSRAWLKTATEMEGLEIAGLVDIVEDAAKARREEFGIAGAKTGSDLEAMLKAVKPDMVFDVTVPEAHTPTTLTALRHGCHVLGEKPMSDSMDNARRMVEAVCRHPESPLCRRHSARAPPAAGQRLGRPDHREL